MINHNFENVSEITEILITYLLAKKSLQQFSNNKYNSRLKLLKTFLFFKLKFVSISFS